VTHWVTKEAPRAGAPAQLLGPADRVGRAGPHEQMPAGYGEEDEADHYSLTVKVTSVPRGSRT
jgi:hypothetical protein